MNLKTYLDNTYKHIEALTDEKPSLWMVLSFNVRCIWNYAIYGAAKIDYFSFRFWEKTRAEKLQYATWKYSKRILYLADTPEVVADFDGKEYMYSKLKKYTKRRQLAMQSATQQDFEQFIKVVPKFIYKPDEGMGGKGISLIDSKDKDSIALYNELKKLDGVLDELVVQHPSISAINPSSVNTIRMFTLKIEDTVYFIGACMRIGMGDIVDNFSSGGIAISVDLRTGITGGYAENHIGKKFYEHPITEVKLQKIQIPNWDKVMNLVFNMACDTKLNYVAWDIAITEDDAVLIEANNNGGLRIIQIGDARGRRKQYEELCQKLEDAHYPKYNLVRPSKMVIY